MLIASTDVHEHAVLVINQLLSEAGAEMINLGAEKNPDEVVSEACVNKVDAILISTHNGMALEYARRLQDELRKHDATIPVIMGGVLNQKVEDKALPVDVTQNLKELGVHVSPKLEGGEFRKMLESGVAKGDPFA
jgi:methylmalonyl-CoA mutase cobalamin-binding domain/chain